MITLEDIYNVAEQSLRLQQANERALATVRKQLVTTEELLDLAVDMLGKSISPPSLHDIVDRVLELHQSLKQTQKM